MIPKLPKFDGTISPQLYNWMTRAVLHLNRNAPEISKGTGSPTTTPNKEGDIFIDTSAGDVYISVGTSSSADWILLN